MKVSPAIEKKYARTRLKGGEVLLTLVGSTGQSFVAPQELAGWNVPRAIAVIRADEEVGADWINICLQSKETMHFLNVRANTTVQKTLNLKDVRDIPILIPPKGVKESIESTVLSLSEKIELNRQTNQTLEHIAQALFKCWFVDFEPTRAKMITKEKGANTAIQELAAQAIICGAITLEQLEAITKNLETTLQQAINEKLSQANQTPINTEQLKTTAALFPNVLVESELGEIPEGWEVRQLPDVIDFLEGPGIRNWQYTEDDDGIKFINIRCIKNGDLNLDTANKLTREEAFGKYAHFQLGVDDIVVSSSGTLGRYAFVRSEHLPLSLNTSVIRFKKIYGVSTLHYIAGYVDTHLQWELEMRASGSAQRNFGPMHLKQIEMLLPSLEILESHNEQLDTLFRLRQSNLKENDLLVNCRDALLPKLLSGELNVSGD